MRKARISVNQKLQVGAELMLAEEIAHHVSCLLRLHE